MLRLRVMPYWNLLVAPVPGLMQSFDAGLSRSAAHFEEQLHVEDGATPTLLTSYGIHPTGNSNPFHFVLNNGPGMEGGLYSQVRRLFQTATRAKVTASVRLRCRRICVVAAPAAYDD